MNKLNTNCNIADVKYDITNAYVEVCLLIGHRMITSGTKDYELIEVAERLLESRELVN